MALGMSQEGLADLAQLNRTYIGKIERGETSVSVEVLQKVANVLNITLSRLIADCERAD
jgi:transcriptional regulator with XRE-family HTH domain